MRQLNPRKTKEEIKKKRRERIDRQSLEIQDAIIKQSKEEFKLLSKQQKNAPTAMPASSSPRQKEILEKLRIYKTKGGSRATIKQINAIRHLDTSKSLAEAMRKGGYTKLSAYNTTRQRALQKILSEMDICSEERVKNDLDEVFTGAKEEKDWTNCNRNIEIRAKVGGLIRPDEKNIQIDKIEIAYKPIINHNANHNAEQPTPVNIEGT